MAGSTAQHKAILVLDTLAPERATVLIRTAADRRGKHYEIATLDDLGIQERAEIARMQTTLEELAPRVDAALVGASDDGDSDLALFEQTVDRFLGVVIRGLPAAVLDSLLLPQKEALLDAFTQASPELARIVAQATTEAIPARRSRASNASTAARRKSGSTSARRSSKPTQR